ncbi:family 16 glycoside hydrolase [Fibrella aquatica]|uniref:family 16 glycoside hydrolase n=1 Tax=Fibrella aquatica TaxID=3242487 RepID=UPI0035212262
MRIAYSLAFFVGSCLSGHLASAQTTGKLPLNDLSAFRTPVSSNWRIAADVMADLAKANTLQSKPGSGTQTASVLVCTPTGQYGNQFNLVTTLEHGDADLEFDFMMAKGANSGVYLQGRYEIQLNDSWGVTTPKSSDVGAVYERWDDSRPEGKKGYEGHPARQNAGKAPGLWQHMRIAFQAPRFDANGKKTANAIILRAELNGVLIHENVELSGPTRGPLKADETARGPLVFQGDHGAVAFRNLTYSLYDKGKPRLTNLSYELYKGNFKNEASFGGTPPESKGPSSVLTAGVTRLTNDFAVKYSGTLHIESPGEYTFSMSTANGAGQMKINNQVVSKWTEWTNSGKITLPAGDMPLEAVYSKIYGGGNPDFQISVTGPGFRQFMLTPTAITESGETDPILVTAETNTILRSFMDLPRARNERGRAYRVTHGISVGSPQQVHYTYDADFGNVVQVWRGMFLDATPMWENRGDGSSRPMGTVNYLGGKPQLALARLTSTDAPWPTDTTGSGFRPKGYHLDDQERPTFRYITASTMVEDQLMPLPDGHGIRRQLTVAQPGTGLYARLASGTSIEPMPNNTYLIDGKTYMIQLTDAGNSQPIVRTSNGVQELLIPVSGKLTYSILF